MEKIPEHILEEINCGEKKACDFYEKYGEAELYQALESVRKSDEEFFARFDSGKIYENVEKKLNPEYGKKMDSGRRKFYFSQKFVPLAVAAALVVMILPVAYRNGFGFLEENTKSVGKSVGTDPKFVVNTGTDPRIKGTDLSLQLYQQTENGVVAIKSGTKLSEGDLIQIAYNPGKKQYGLIFSIDGNQNVTNHFGTDEFETEQMYSKLNYLDFSYQLDDAPKFEVFIMINGDRPLNQSESQKLKSNVDLLKTKKLNQLRNIKFIKKTFSWMNDDFEISTFVILK